MEQVYATASILWASYYQNYLTKKEFYTRTIDDLTNLEQKVTQALYQVAQDSSVKFGDVIDESKLKGYLSALSTNTNTSDLQYLQQITALKDYYNSLNNDSPSLDMYQAFLKELLLNLQEENFNNYPTLYITWQNKNNKNTNLLKNIDAGDNQINNLKDGTSDSDAVNLKQLRQEHSTSLWKIDNNFAVLKTAKPIDMQGQRLQDLPDKALYDDEAVSFKQIRDEIKKGGVWEQTSDSRTVIINPTDVDMQNKKIIELADAVNDKDAVNYKQLQDTNANVTINTKVGLLNSKNIATNKSELNNLENITSTSFFTKVENSSVQQIKNIKNDATKAKVDFIVSGNNLILRDTPQPNGTIDLSTNSTGFYNSEMANKLNLTNNSYKLIWNLEIHNQNSEDFIHVWPNTNIILYHGNGVTIDKKGGSFIIHNINGVYRRKKESATNKTKRLLQAHFWYGNSNYQIFFIDNNGDIFWLADMLKQKEVIVRQNNLIWEVL